MSTPIGELLVDVDNLRRAVGHVRTPQIRSGEIRAHIKAVGNAWFNTYRQSAGGRDLGPINTTFQSLLTDAERSPSATKVRKQLKKLRLDIVALQADLVAHPEGTPGPKDPPPPFAAIPDPDMRKVLIGRWDECVACLSANAPLAATVMMGGLLESLFLSRVNREPNQSSIFATSAAPKDKQGKPWPLTKWGLGIYIAVAHELGWITQSGRDVSSVLQNYRNYVHPQKELSSQVLTVDDARMFWAVFKALAQRLL